MFWLDAGVEPRVVSLKWTRAATSDGETTIDTMEIADAIWTIRGNSHYVTYTDAEEMAGESLRTTLRLEKEQLTMIRYGAVRWNHTFRQGNRQTSTMHVGAMGVQIEASTTELVVDVTQSGGEVRLSYQMELAGDEQQVVLTIAFGSAAARPE